VAHPLDLSGVRAKLDRTDQQTVFLNTEWRTFRDKGDAYGVDFKRDPQTGGYVAYLRVFKPIDIRLSVIFGEIIHNFRSALNHLICRLVEGYGGTAGKHHDFPICLDEADFRARAFSRGKDKPGLLEGIPPSSDVWACIEDAQPYKCGDAARDQPFSVINRLSNEDKHRTLNGSHVLLEPADLIDSITHGEAFCTDIKPHFVLGQPAEDGTNS